MDPTPAGPPPLPPQRPRTNNLMLILILSGFAGLWVMSWVMDYVGRAQITYGYFLEQLEAGNVAEARIHGLELSGKFVNPPTIPFGKVVPKPMPVVGYGLFVSELDRNNIAEAHTDGHELVGKFKAPPQGTAEPTPTATAASTATATATATATPASTTPAGKSKPPVLDFRTRLGLHSGKELEDKLIANLGANYTVEASLDSYLTTREPPSEADAKKKAEPLPENFVVTLSPLIGENFDEQLREKLGPRYQAEPLTDNSGVMMTLYIIVSVLLLGGMWMMFRRSRDPFGGGGFLTGFSKSPAKRYDGGGKKITFADVAGLEGVKQDLAEIVEFLKSPAKFQRLGGRIPKGVLLFGPPGTGKTLLAKAVAGEAGVPFFSINGSEFIQMFVGVGAGRVRDLFKTAKEASPCILFIDEIDAVGRVRGAGLGGGHDEREQTLNQILSEMDGFSPNESVIVLAATNRPDVLDPALLRPGRFDRHVTIDRPTLKGREAILKVHTREVPLADDVDISRIAAGTIGLTGADLRNLVNEAALWATRQNRDRVTMDDFEFARDKILMGAKREEVLSEREKLLTAYHEAGHALLAWLLPGADRVHKVTVVPRGRALGVTQLLPDEDRMNVSEHELHARLTFMLGGRAAEKLVYDEYSAGAEDDLKRSTQLARRMVATWGMSERLGPIAFRTSEEHPFLGKEMAEHREFSEHTAQLIDEEAGAILRAADERARKMLSEQREKLDVFAHALAEKEELNEAEIAAIIGPAAERRHKKNGKVD